MKDENMQDAAPDRDGRRMTGSRPVDFALVTGLVFAWSPETTCFVVGIPVNGFTTSLVATVGVILFIGALATLRARAYERKPEDPR